MSDETTRRVPQPEGEIPAAAPAPDSPDALVGRTFGQYEIFALVSESMALVYRARQATPRREVALKVPRGLGRIPDEVRRRFLREVQLNVGMSHPNIVGVLDAGEVEGVPFYTMPFVEGQRLDRFVEERKPDLRWRLGVFRRLCEVVQTLHRDGLVHRDLKSPNVMIDRDGEVRLLDFGLAKLSAADGPDGAAAGATLPRADAAVTQDTGVAMGTPRFMAPEQTLADRPITPAADVYALGVILYWLLTDRFPYELSGEIEKDLRTILQHEPKPPSALNPSLPKILSDLALACLAKDPARRPATAGALAEEAAKGLAELEVRRSPALRFLRFWTWRRAAALALAAGVAAAILLPAWRWGQRRAVLRRVTAAYQNLQTYRDFSIMRQPMGVWNVTARNEFAFAKPNRFRLHGRFDISGLTLDADFVCNGTNLWIHIPLLGQYMERPAPDSIMELVDRGANIDPANDLIRYSLKPYELVLTATPEKVIAERAQQARVSRTHTIDREPVYQLEWTETRRMAVPHETATRPSEWFQVQVPLTARARQSDGLFVELIADVSELYAGVRRGPGYRDHPLLQSTNVQLHASHTAVQINVPIDAAMFEFKAPRDAEKVNRFDLDRLGLLIVKHLFFPSGSPNP